MYQPSRLTPSLRNLALAFAATLVPSAVLGQVVSLLPTSARTAGSGSAGYTADFGTANTVALNTPSYIVYDTLGNQFLSDTVNNCIRRVDTNGNITTVAGLKVPGQGDTCNTSSNPTPTAAQGLYQPTGLAVDSANNLYISDSLHNCVRRLPSGAVGASMLTTVAGVCGSVPTASPTPNPNGLVVDSSNNLFISLRDTEVLPALSTYQVVRHASAADPLTFCLVAGDPSALVPNTCPGITNTVSLNNPASLALDVTNNLYIADTGNNCVRELFNMTILGTAVGQCANDGSGSASTALHAPYGLVTTLIQTLFISESNPDQVRGFSPATNTLSLIAGSPNGAAGPYSTSQDGQSGRNITLNGPRGLAIDLNGAYYVADSGNNIVRQLNFNLNFPTLPVGAASAIQPITFSINQPVNLSARTGTDFSIVANTCAGPLSPGLANAPPNTCQVFVRFTPSRPGLRQSPIVITDSISGTTVTSGLLGTGTGALGVFVPGPVDTVVSNLNNPSAATVDSAGNVYFLERGSNGTGADVRRISAADGTVSTPISQFAGLVTPSAIAIDAANNVYIADSATNAVARFGSDGAVNLNYVAGLDTPTAVVVDAYGNLYIAQAGTTHNVTVVFAGGVRKVVAGSGSDPAANGVLASTAKFSSPAGLALDVNGVLYISDSTGRRVYAVDKAGYIHFLAGNGTATTTTPGLALGTGLLGPTALAADAAGDIYIVDQQANRVYAAFSSSSSGANIGSLIGTGVAGYSGDKGPSNLAQVKGPLGVAVDANGSTYIVDAGNQAMRRITYPTPTVDFGPVILGTSKTLPQYIGNIGTDPLVSTNPIVISDPHFTLDPATTTCGQAVLPGIVCSYGFTFTPTANINYSATATLFTNAFNSPQIIKLIGHGGQLAPLPGTFPGETEVFGQPFPETFNFTGSGPAPTGTLTYSVNGVTVCTQTGTLAAICNAPPSGLDVGNYTVTITYSGDNNYLPSTSTTTLAVTPAPYVINGGTFTRPYGQPNPSLAGTTSTTAPGDTILVTYSTTATTDSPTGTYPVTATVTAVGNTKLSNYTITNNPGTLTITPATLTVTVGSASRLYGQPNPAFSNTGVTGLKPGDVVNFSYSTTATPASPVGTYPITATISGPSAANYTLVVVPGTLTVNAAPLTITLNNATRPYGQPNPTFTFTTTGAQNGDSFSSLVPTTTATPSSPVGTYPITATVPAGAPFSNYNVTINPATLTVTRATLPLTVTANNATRVYGSPDPAFTSTVTGAQNGDTFTITYTTNETITSPVGTYTITPVVSGPAAANYTVVTAPGTLTVTPRPLTVSANDATRPYGQPNPVFTGTGPTGLVNGDTATLSFTTPATQSSPVGTYPIVPVVTAGPGTSLSNYTVNATNGTLTITKATVTLTATVVNATRVYGDPNPVFASTVTGAINGDTFTVNYGTTATAASPVGTYPITATVTGPAAANYTIVVVPGTLTITPRPLSISADNATRPYGQPNPVFTGTGPTGLVNGDTATLSFTTPATLSSPVGTYPINPVLTAGPNTSLSNYAINVTPGTLIVTRAALTLTAAVVNVSRQYGQPNPPFTSTITGAVNGDTFTVTYSTPATTSSPVGTYPITATITGSNIANYNVTVVPGTLTVTPAPLTVTVANASRAYGAANPPFSATVTGAVNGDIIPAPVLSTPATSASPAGTYPINAALPASPVLNNYTVTIIPGTLTINKAPVALNVRANDASRVYGSPNPAFTSTITGAVNGDTFTVTYSTPATPVSPVGTYPIIPTITGPNAANYTITTTNGTLTVTPATLTVAANNVTRSFGTPNPIFSAAPVVGLLNGDTVGLVLSTPATINSAVGVYPINASLTGPASGNYTISVVSGTLTIVPANTSTTLTSSAATASSGSNVTFTATVSSLVGVPPGTVTFSDGATVLGTVPVNAGGVATLSITTLSVGSHNINASFTPGNANFNPSGASLLQTIIPGGTFAISATPNSQFIRGAGTSVYNVTVTSLSGFTGPVALTCKGLPADATCSFANPVVTLTANGTATTTMSVTNTNADATIAGLVVPALNGTRGLGQPSSTLSLAPLTAAAVLPFELTGLGAFLAGIRRRKSLTRSQLRLLMMVACTLGLMGLAGCGCPSSAFKTYPITITGTSVNGGPPPQSTVVYLSVGQGQ